MTDDSENSLNKTDDIDLEKLLAEKDKLESLIRRKFTKVVTVMFTDLTGSTKLAEELGDLAMRTLLKRHYDIVLPVIEMHAGVLVKTMGDGTMSYFEEPSDGVRAAIKIQEEIDKFNHDSHHPELLIRCGLNTGVGIVEKKDVNGDVVNVSQRFEALAKSREILISKDTYEPVKDKEEFSIVFLKEAQIKGKSGLLKAYKVLWEPEEIERFKKGALPPGVEDEYDGGGAATSDFNISDIKLEIEAKFTVTRKGAEPVTYELSSQPRIIGRSSKADIVIPEQYISRQHAKIYKEKDDFYIEDLKSHVGISFEGVKFTKRKMANGETYQIGSVSVKFEMSKKQTTRDQAFYEDSDETLTFDPGSILSLVLKEQGRDVAKYELSAKPLIIGRQEGCDIRLQSPMVSRRHAQVFAKDFKAHIEDFGSNNGTYVEGEKITKGTAIHGQQITIGPFAIQVLDPLKPIPSDKQSKAGKGS